MSTLIVDVPDDLADELRRQHISDDVLNQFVVQAVKAWLHTRSPSSPDEAGSSPFSQSAVPFIDQLLDENEDLFRHLAEL